MVQPAAAQMEQACAQEADADDASREDEARAQHLRLLALVRAASGEPEGRAGVWMEHSYARAKNGPGAVRVLLARAPPADDDEPDVTGGPASPPAGPAPALEDDAEPAWEARLAAAAPSAAHARLAREAGAALRALRLARLAGAAGAAWRDAVRAAARRVRRALAPLWAGGAAGWLGGALGGAALWREVAGELRRAVPRLAARLGPVPPPAPLDPLDRTGPAVSAARAGPWLAWVESGAGGEARWARRLRALLHTRTVRCAAPGPGPGAGAGAGAGAAPDAWCAAAAQQARAGLADIVADAGSHPIIVGGAGAGAALVGALLAGNALAGAGAGAGAGAESAVRAVVLISPPLLTAEGEVTHLHRNELELPLLVVVGSRGAACGRGAACALLAGGGAGGAGAGGATRRVVEVRGADDALRLPARLRRRLGVPQQAIDAAVAEEALRWALQAADGEPPRRAARREADEERRGTLQTARGLLREASSPAPPAAGSAESTRVVARGSGATPLPLPPPRPRAPAPAALAPAPAPAPAAALTPAAAEPELDIMQLPIVFADDDPPAPPAPPAAPDSTAHTENECRDAELAAARGARGAGRGVTVTSGHSRGGRALSYTRVIVAKRRGGAGGAGAGAGGRGAGAGARGAGAGARGAARPVLLRRTVRLVHKARPQ